MSFTDLPLDVLHPILAHLSDRRDWHTCALVNKSFNQVTTPLLYQTLDSRVKNVKLYHPSQTILLRPELAKYVRHVTETGAVHFTYRHVQPTITADTVHALSLCTNLHSLTWTDDCGPTSFPHLFSPTTHHDNQRHTYSQLTEQVEYDEQHPLLSLLSGIRSSHAPLRELVIHSNSDLGSHVWSELSRWTGLTKIGIWCMEGPPRVLQGWAGLGRTLKELELRRCAGVPPTILISVLSQLPLLEDLHIKGVQASAMLTILTVLPNLQALDTEYLNSGSNIWPRDWPFHLRNQDEPSTDVSLPATPTIPQLPTLRTLTVRTSSIDSMGPNKLFVWIRVLSTNPGLESFRLLTFTASGCPSLPLGFILEMARWHHASLRKWIVPSMQMTLFDIGCLCARFGKLEEVACGTAVVVGDVDSIKGAISSAKNLRTLWLHVQWIPRAPSLSQYQQKSNDQEGKHRNSHSYSNARSGSSSLTPLISSSPPCLSLAQQEHSSTGPDGDRYTNTGNADLNTDSDTIVDTDSDSDNSDTDTVPNFRFSGGTNGRGVFGFDQVGVQYANSSNLLRYSEVDLCARRGKNEARNGKDSTGRGRSYDLNWRSCTRPFTLEHAKDMMLRDGSKLRVIAVGGVVYAGKWIWESGDIDGGKGGCRKFEVEDVEGE